MNIEAIGRKQKKITVIKEKAHNQSQVSTGKRQAGRLMVLGDCTYRLMTSADSTGHQPGVYLYLPLTGDRPVFFPAPSLFEAVSELCSERDNVLLQLYPILYFTIQFHASSTSPFYYIQV